MLDFFDRLTGAAMQRPFYTLFNAVNVCYNLPKSLEVFCHETLYRPKSSDR